MKSMHVRVEGRVQGVWFRDYTQKKARKLQLTGWVRNVQDGSVETFFSGEEDAVQAMFDWLQQGSPQSRVENVHIIKNHLTELDSSQLSPDFEIRY